MSNNRTLYRANKGDRVLWVDEPGVIGEHVFTFDRKQFYNLFADYPDKLTVEEWLIFNRENEYWRDFFIDRNIEYEREHSEEIEKHLKNNY